MAEAERLRELAAWYRAFAERAGNPVIWDCRLRMAEDLEAAAEAIRHDARPDCGAEQQLGRRVD